MQPLRRGVGVLLVALISATAWSAVAGAAPPETIGCAQSVYGPLHGWRTAPTTIVAGTVAWPFFGASQRHAFYGPHNGLAVSVKALLLVKPGRTATLRIPASERTRLSLLYRSRPPRGAWHDAEWYRVSDGAAAITFRACRPGNAGWTQFAGAFLARGAQCAVVEVRASGSTRWLHRRLPLGGRTCR